MSNKYIKYPPTPAFAKAGSAPGTTGGVELGSRVASKGTRHQGNTSVSYMPQTSTMLLPNSYTYMPQDVQDCRLPGLKPSKRFRRPPRQQLLQLLHAPAICFSGGSRLPFARPQTPQTLPTLPQASKATTLTATCPCHLFFRGFKTAVCPPSNPPNASNAPAGLQGNNSYSYPLSATCPRHLPCSCRTLTPTCPRTFKTAVCPASNPPNASAGLQGNNSYSYYMPLPSVFQGVQDCRLPALKPPKRFQRSRRPPRQQLLQLHAPAICFSGGSRLPFARPQTPQTLPTLPQASKATTLTATLCQLHAPDIYHAPAELLHLHAPGRSRLPFARPQTLQTLPQASKATTLTATTCPCHLFFRGFKTAVCPPSNPPNASNAPAGLQGNNSYSYMPLPSVFQGVQDCRLPALKPPKRFQRSRRPPRQQLLQLHVPKPSKRFQPSRRPPRPCHLFFRGSRLPFARPQTPQTLPTLPQASKATTLTATTCPCHLFFRGFKTAVCPPSNPPNASNAPAGLQGNNSYSYMPLPSVFQGVQDCRLPALKPPKRFQRSRRPPRQQLLQLPSVSYMPQTSTMLLPNSYTYMPQDVQDCRLPGLKPSKRFRRPPRQQLLQLLHAPAICFSGGSRLPFARPQTPQTLPTLPQASKATTLTATCPCHLFFRGFKTAVCPPSNPPNASNAPAGLQGNNSYSYMSPNPPNASNPLAGLPGPAICFSGVQDCRLPALKPPKRFQRSRRPPRQQLLQLHVLKPSKRFQPSRRPPRQQLLQLHAPAICFSGGSRLPFARPSNPPNASNALAGLQGNNSYSYMSNAPAGLRGNNSYRYMPLPSVFQGVQDCRLPALKPPKRFQRSRRPPRQQLLQLHAPAICFSGVQDCRLPALKPPKRFQRSRRPPRQQLLQLHAPAICFSGGSRLPFARPQTPQTLPTLPQASKATTLTATCPCHLFFRGFKTAVCPPSNPPNASNAPAGLQGNNSYSYMSPNPPNASNPLAGLPGHAICFSGVQDCRLPALKPPKRFQRSRRPPRQQLLQLLHAPAICFSGGSRLPFARPQTPQTLPTLPQASKATTLTATCPCHLFFRGFKTAVCPPSNPPNASNAPAGLQGNNSYSYPLSATCPRHLPCSCRTLTPTCPRAFKTAVCPASNPPNASAGLQGNNSYSYYMPLPSVFQGVQDCRLPALKPPKRFQRSRRPPRQQLLQLHAPAICFSGGSRLPFARPQTPQTLPTLPQASKATTLTATCPQTLQTLPTLSQASQALPSVFQGFKTAVCPPSNPPNASNAPAGLQGNNSYSYMSSNPPNASNPLAGLQGNNSYSYMPLPSVFHGVQDCRLPALKPPKRFQRSRRPPRQQLLQLHVQRSRRPPRQQLLQLHAPAICFSGGSRLPFARPQTPQTLPTLPQASKATTLTATCPCHLFFRGFKTAVCPPSNPPNASNAPEGLQGNNSYSYMSLPSVFQGVQDWSRKHSYMPLPSVFHGVQDCRLPGLKPSKRFRRPPRQQLLQLHAPAICFSGGSRLPFARPQTPQTLQTLPQASKATTLTATCPCHLFFRGSRLPSQAKAHATFARPQTLQTLPHASKATTLTATTCPCHLFFRGFKTAVCPPSNPPNASNAPAGLQGNNSYSYMPLPSIFHGVQDCRLPGLKRPKRF